MYIAASALRISSSASAGLLGVGAAERDADARADQQVLADGRDRHLEAAHEALGEFDHHRGVTDFLDQDGELVSAEARGRIGRPYGFEQTDRDLLQHLVAGGVAEAVVDRLEVVEVEEDDGDARALARRARQCVLDPVGEQRAVGQAGHCVVERLVCQLLLERRTLAGVSAVEHDAADVLVVAEVGGDDFELERATVAVDERAVERLRARGAVAGRLQELLQPPAVAVQEQVLERVPKTSSALSPRMRWIDGLW